MSQSVAHSRQQSKNQKQLQTLKKDKSKGDLDSKDNCYSPQNKCYSLIKRFHKKQPENFENSHLKYLQNGIKDVGKRNTIFQMKAHQNNQTQHQDRINMHKRFTDPYLKEDYVEQPMSNTSKNRIKDQCSNYNLISSQNANSSYSKQGSVKPIRTICLNLYETQEQLDQSPQLTSRREKNQSESALQSSKLDLNLLNKSAQNQQIISNQQINQGKVQYITNSSATQLSNSTRFSPRQGINLASQNSQQSIKLVSKDQTENQVVCGSNLFGFPESSESDLNQNDSTITTPTKYQQFYEGQYNIGKNIPQYSKYSQNFHQNNASSNSSFNKNNYQISTTTPKIYKKNQDKSTNQSSIKEKSNNVSNIEISTNANNSLNSSKVNLCFFLKGVGGKQACSSNQFSLINSNLNSRKSSNQINSCDSHQLFSADLTIQENVQDNKIKNSNKNSRGNSISKNKNNYLNELQATPKQQQNNQFNNNYQQQNGIALIKKLNRSNQNSQNTSFTQLQNKIKSFEVQPTDFMNSKNAQQTTQIIPNSQKNLISNKILPQTNQQSTNCLNNVNYTQINLMTSGLVQSCNMNSLKTTNLSNAEQNNQNFRQLQKDKKERDRSQTYTLDTHIRKRSTSKGQISISNNKTASQNQISNKSQLKLNQSSSQINLSSINAQSIIPSQNSAFNFQPSFFTPIDNDSIKGYIQKQTSRNNSQVNEQHQQLNQIFTKQKSCTQFELYTITSFVQLEEELEKNAKQQKQQEIKRKTQYLF